MDSSLTAALGLGLLLGLRHALDPDHLAAVSALVSRHRSVVRSCILGASWGAGHGLAVLVAGIAILGFKLTITPGIERALERGVALVLVLLGGHVLWRAAASFTLDAREHWHGGRPHTHVHVHVRGVDTGHAHVVWLAGRPFLVGALHGLAGSAGLTLLVLGTIESPVAGLLYLLVFGVGSMAGMLLLSGLIGIPFALASRRSQGALIAVQALAGAVSLVLGVAILARGGA
jgi:hypothetical protein